MSPLQLKKRQRAVAAIVVIPAALFAQAFTASISGIVTDATGAVVDGVVIRVTDLERNMTFDASSNDQGFYLVTSLLPGRYSVAAEKPGFRKFILDVIPLSTQQKASVNVALQIGQLAESVQVTGRAQLIEANTSTLGTVTENKKIVDLPINGRNIHNLVLLTPGVVGWQMTGGVGESYESQGRYVVNGGRESGNAVQLDGVAGDLTSYIPGYSNYSALPSVEGVQEFRIQTNAFSAEYGRSGGGLVTMVTKSGTNEIHGSLYDFLRNSALDANSFFNNTRGVNKGSFKRNEFGATAGGPIYLPKLYNGKNRSFFFAAFEGRRNRNAMNQVDTIPSALERQGDFSQTVAQNGALRVIYNPFTTRTDPARANQFLRDPFPGNRIPAAQMDPIALNTQKYYPQPNRDGLAFTHQQNYVEQGTIDDGSNRGTLKVDHNFSDRQRTFFRYTVLNLERFAPQIWGDNNPGCPSAADSSGGCIGSHQRQQNAALDYTNTLSSSMVVNIRYGFGRGLFDRNSTYLGFAPSTLGFPTYVEKGADALLFPNFQVSDMSAPGFPGSNSFRNSSNQHEIGGSVSTVTGRHTLKWGADLRIFLINHMQASYNAAWTFARAQTQGPDPRVASNTAGVGYASFLLGVGASGSVATSIRPAIKSRYQGFYMQDDYKVSRKLTLNIGLRWDIEGGSSDRYDRISVFDPYVRSPLSDQVGINLKGGYLFPDTGLGRRSVHPADWLNFGPRFGFAYELTPQTAIRAGYGIFFGAPPYASVYTGPMYNASTPWLPLAPDGVTPYRTMKDPFPDGQNVYEGSKNGLLAAISSGVGAAVPSTMAAPYNQQWNFTIQRVLAPNLVLETAYAGNKGTHLPLTWQMNQLDPALVSADMQTTVPNPFFGLIPTGSLAQTTVQKGQLYRPFPQYGGVNFNSTAWGNSNYHALQVKVERRFARGASAMLSYTFSKLIDDGGDNAWASAAGYRDFYCRACDRALAVYDIPQRLVANFTYELPFGRGKWVGAGWNKMLDAVLGQWQANGIITYCQSQPLQLTVQTNTSYSFGGNQKPNSTGTNAALPPDQRTLARWFDTSQFLLPTPYTFGNIGRTTNLRSDALKNADFSLFKNLRIRERAQVQFRAESFSALNHTTFGAPNTTLGALTFGQVTGAAAGTRSIQLALKVSF